MIQISGGVNGYVNRALLMLEPDIIKFSASQLTTLHLSVCTRLAATYRELTGDGAWLEAAVDEAWSQMAKGEFLPNPALPDELLARLPNDAAADVDDAYAADALIAIAEWFREPHSDVVRAALDLVEGYILDQGPLAAGKVDEDATFSHPAFTQAVETLRGDVDLVLRGSNLVTLREQCRDRSLVEDIRVNE